MGRFLNEENECCVRLFNRRFPVVTDYQKLYHNLDVSAYFLLLVRGAIAMIEQEGVFKTRERVKAVVADVLATYRNKLCFNAPNCTKSIHSFIHSLGGNGFLMISTDDVTRITFLPSSVPEQLAEVATYGNDLDECLC